MFQKRNTCGGIGEIALSVIFLSNRNKKATVMDSLDQHKNRETCQCKKRSNT